jgi:AraC-like DNA-binding protein
VPESSPWSRFTTTEPELAHEFMRGAYVDLDVSVSVADSESFTTSSVGTQVAGLALARLRYSGLASIRTAPADHLTFVYLRTGGYAVGDGRLTHAMTVGQAFLIPPDRQVEAHFDDIDVSSLIVPRDLVEDVAGAVTGRGGEPVTFFDPGAVSPALEAHWSRTVAYAQGTLLGGPGVADNPLLTGPARRALAAAALAAFPNSTQQARHTDGGNTEPAVLRRVVAHVEANASRDLSLAELAAVAGTSTRALQYAFLRHRETTPSAFVRSVRLERAHRDLQAADPTTATVAGIARHWGFPHAGRFSADYRTAYGRAPSVTLRS